MKKAESLDPRFLHIGDIILTTSKFHPFSIFIRIFTWSRYSHAAIYVGRNTIVEAVSKGVRTHNILRWSEGLNGHCIVLRARNGTVAKYAANQCEVYHGARYSGWDAILSGIAAYLLITFPLKIKHTHMFCSRMIAEAFSNHGYDLSEKHYQLVRPKDLENSDRLDVITPVFIETPQHEKVNSMIGFELVTNELISDVIKFMKQHKIKHKGLVSVAGIIEIAEKYKDLDGFDKELSEIFENSKFYSQWKIEKRDNPRNWDAKYFWELSQSDRLLAEREIQGRVNMHRNKIIQFAGEIDALNGCACYKGYTFKSVLNLRNILLQESQTAYNSFYSALSYLLK